MLSGCGDNLPVTDAGATVDGGFVAPIEVTWSIWSPFWGPITCEEMGFAEVQVNFGGPKAPCEARRLLTPPMAIEDWFFVTFLDATGRTVAGVRGDLVGEGPDGTWRALVTFLVYDEPERQMQRIFDGAVAHHASTGTFPGDAATTPAFGTCCVSPGQVCWGVPALWDQSPWPELGFELAEIGRFSYGFAASDVGFTITAMADFDCDGIPRVYAMNGSVELDGTITGRDTIEVVDDD